MSNRLTTERIAKQFGVPPWLVDPAVPVPRHRRVAWLWLRLRWRFERRRQVPIAAKLVTEPIPAGSTLHADFRTGKIHVEPPDRWSAP